MSRLVEPNHPQSSSSSHLDEFQAQDEEATGGTAGRGRGFVSGIGRRALILRLPRQRPRPLVTTKTCLGCRMYRPRTTFAALMMLTGGLIFLIMGLTSLGSSSERGMSLTILGGISIYASYVLLGIYLRWDNFDGTMLPSYDDEEMENEDGRI